VISFQHNWNILLISIVIAVGLSTYVNTDKMTKFLFRKKNVSIIASVLFGSFTPLCAAEPQLSDRHAYYDLTLGPIMAFLTSSPLMSPMVLYSLRSNWPSICDCINSSFPGNRSASGLITNLIERRQSI
jgi:uncharacterized membrane protein YraQ (UPF0718 family)